MQPDRSTAVPWVVAGLVFGVLCCLCLVLAVTVPLAIAAWGGSRTTSTPEMEVPESPALPASPTPPGFNSGGPLPWPQLPVSEDARRMQELLAQVVIPAADPVELAGRFLGLSDIPRVVAETALPVPRGTVQSFWVLNDDTQEYSQVLAEMVYDSPHAYFWVEQGVAYDLRDVERLIEAFENQIYPTNREFFGSEWTPGIDGDPHLYILFVRGLGSWVAGYFGGSDEYPPMVEERSNAHEMFYISADGQSLADEYTYATLAHEFQHMIHWAHDPNEENWLEEGLSDLATFLNGYAVGGWDYVYAEDPDLPLTFWPSGDDSSVHYGQSFLFVEYFLDRFGHEATQALAAHEENGLRAMDQTLLDLNVQETDTGRPITTDDLFRDWAVALLLQDPGVSDGRYAMDLYENAPQMSAKERHRLCPVPPQDLEVNQYGIDVIGIDCGGDRTLVFDAPTMVAVVPADPHSGGWAFWSNRGNVSDMTLTRAFDLTEAAGPVELSYWTWYDLEEDWDYVYLQVSDDGGDTWEILTTPSGRGTDPTGNSYGWGYTGMSGGGAAARWIEEAVDLSAFAGSEVLLRFEYVTDASINGEGFVLDDVSIPAIGYGEDFEDGDDGWTAEGFVRLHNRVPQSFRLVLVETGRQTRVTEIELDEANHAEVPLALGGDYDQANLLIMATARDTWRPAPYRLEVR